MFGLFLYETTLCALRLVRVYLFFLAEAQSAQRKMKEIIFAFFAPWREKNKYYNFMMNLDFAALHPGYPVIQPVMQGITGFSICSKRYTGADPCGRKKSEPACGRRVRIRAQQGCLIQTLLRQFDFYFVCYTNQVASTSTSFFVLDFHKSGD